VLRRHISGGITVGPLCNTTDGSRGLRLSDWCLVGGKSRRRIAVAVCLISIMALSISERPASGAGLGPSNVLVLYNDASPEGQQIADYYAQVHPGVQLLGLSGVSSAEQISADEYLSAIRPQILPALTDSIDVIVTTKGLPVRITTAPHVNPVDYTDPFGVERTIFPTTWKPYSSLESELTRIDTFSTWEQLGDQTYWLPPEAPGAPHPSSNPYYNANNPFDRQTYSMRLASRLDGFSVADVTDSIDRAQRAFIGTSSAGPFHVLLDDDPDAQDGFPADRMEVLRDDVLEPYNVAYTYDETDAFVASAPGPVIGYVSHGIHGGAPQGYLRDPEIGLDITLANGAVFHSHESFNARSFDPEFSQPQALVAEWIAAGGTAALGHVQEPQSGQSNVTNEDIVFRMLLEGHTWAEAAWSATRQLSYVNTVVGDPLMVFRPLVPGDTNLDGKVGTADAATLGTHFGAAGQPGGNMWAQGDVNHDGRVNSADLALLNSHWGESAGYFQSAAEEGLGVTVSPLSSQTFRLPEPSSGGLAAMGVVLAVLARVVTIFCRVRRGWTCCLLVWLPIAYGHGLAAADDVHRPQLKFFFYHEGDVSWVVSSDKQRFAEHLVANDDSFRLASTLHEAVLQDEPVEAARKEMGQWIEQRREQSEQRDALALSARKAEGIIAYLRAHDFSMRNLVAALLRRSGASAVEIVGIHRVSLPNQAEFKIKVILEHPKIDMKPGGINVELASATAGYAQVIYALGLTLYEVHETISASQPPEELPGPEGELSAVEPNAVDPTASFQPLITDFH